MGIGGIWHWVLVLLVVLVLFGRGRVSEIMGDFGKGIKSFKQGLNDDDKPATPPVAVVPAAQIPPQAVQPAVPTPHPQEPTLNGEPVVETSQPVR